MMKIEVTSTLGQLAYEVAAWLEERGAAAEVAVGEGDRGFALLHGADCSPRELIAIQRAVYPFAPPLRVDPELRGQARVVLSLSPDLDGGREVDRPVVVVQGETEAVVEELREGLGGCGYRVSTAQPWFSREETLRCADPTAPVVQLLRWILAARGIEARLVVARYATAITVHDPRRASLDPLRRFPLEVLVDDPAMASGLEAAMAEAGISTVVWRVTDDPGEAFELDLGPWAWLDRGRPGMVATLAVRRFLEGLGVDAGAFPLVTRGGGEDEGAAPRALLCLPLGRWRDGLLQGRGRRGPACYQLHLFTDDRDLSRGLCDDLVAAGFHPPRLRPLRGTAVRSGFRVQWGAAEGDPEVRRSLLSVVHAHVATLAGGGAYEVKAWKKFADGDHDIYIWFPAAAFTDGTYDRQRRSPATYRVTVRALYHEQWAWLAEEVTALGFDRCTVVTALADDDGGDGYIEYGGAPRELIDRLVRLLEERTAVHLHAHRIWSEEDTDIWIRLPNILPEGDR